MLLVFDRNSRVVRWFRNLASTTLLLALLVWISTFEWTPTWMSPDHAQPTWLFVIVIAYFLAMFVLAAQQSRRMLKQEPFPVVPTQFTKQIVAGCAMVVVVAVLTFWTSATNGWFGYTTASSGTARILRIDDHGDTRIVTRHAFNIVVTNNTRLFLLFLIILCTIIVLADRTNVTTKNQTDLQRH